MAVSKCCVIKAGNQRITVGSNMKKIFNFDYFNIRKEIFLFFKIAFVKNFISDKTAYKSGGILIVNPCLIGDFMASVLAIRDFIKRNSDKKIDIIVSPPLKSLAQRIIGVRNVFIAKSVYERKLERTAEENQNFDAYEKVVVLRASPEAYRIIKRISAAKIETGLWHFLKYGFHMGGKLIARRIPKPFREINFEMLEGVPRDIPFDEIFKFKPEDYENIKTLPVIRLHNKKIIIHTGSSWPMMRWEKEKWVRLLQKIHTLGFFEFIFIGAEKDIEDYEYISSHLKFKTHSVISQISLPELMLLLRSADYFIGVDSGPANMAHLVHLRSIVIFGPGPHMFMPSDSNDIIIDKSNGRGFYQRFFLKKNGFIQRIDAEEVYQAFYNLHLK